MMTGTGEIVVDPWGLSSANAVEPLFTGLLQVLEVAPVCKPISRFHQVRTGIGFG